MSPTTHPAESTAAVLYVALELGATEWQLTVSASVDGRRHRARMAPGDRARFDAILAAAQRRLAVTGPVTVRSCYEAGRDGFWPHRFLTAAGVSNLVVDSSSIEVPRRVRRAKTDRLDGEKLLRLLLRHWGGEREMWQVVQVPTRDAEDARHASRGVTTLQKERTRLRNRIRGLLGLHGVRQIRFDAQFPTRVTATVDWAGEPLPAGVVARILATYRVLQTVEAECETARRAERQAVTQAAAGSCAQRLAQLRGVGPRSATILADELLGRGLRNRREVGALSGLVSAPFRSGTIQRDQGLVRSGVPAVRRLAIELAWAWLRYQPTSALTRWYQRRFGGGGAVTRRIGVVALARRIVIALWRYSETGALPEGAQLKAAAA